MSQDVRVQDFVASYEALRSEVETVIVGHREIIDHVLIGMFAGGHVLLEGVPGLGKTLLVKTLAEGLHLTFSRIQFTPDLMPADIIGTNIIVEDADGRKHFQFQSGPIFAHILLADEINRATPKTQSALLEGMQEGAVTVGGATRPLPAPFFVLATQNPIEMEGTYPLPEAQLDRFLLKLRVRYPAIEELNAIIDRTTQSRQVTVERVMSGAKVLSYRELIREVPVAAHVRDLAALASVLAAALLVAGAMLGAVWGALKRTNRADAARLADRAFGLEDRVATALEWAQREDRTPLVDALVADATARVEQVQPRHIVRRIVPREARFLPVPMLIALALTLAPALPLPSPRLPDFTPGGQEEEKEQRTGSGLLEQRSKAEARERLRPPTFEEREFQARSGASTASTAGDPSPRFKETALSSQRPDFNSFLKR